MGIPVFEVCIVAKQCSL